MTLNELKAAWQRWMHRNDIAGDADTIYRFAAELVHQQLMMSEVDIDDMLANAPRSLFHAGLVYLHELAQDDEGKMREQQLLTQALQDYTIRASIDREIAPQMRSPHYAT